MTDAVLELSHLRIAYRSRHGHVRAVEDASLVARRGEALGLVGESGSGKSTVARAALGLLPRRVAVIEGGTLCIDGVAVNDFTEHRWADLRGRPVAIVFQDPLGALNPVMRVGRQIGESVRRHDPLVPVRPRVAELLDLVRLPADCIDAYPHELSGGMRQRVLLAIALGCRPSLLVADEPTTALDVTTQAEILALLQDLRRRLGMALLLISHDLAVVSMMCDRVTVMYAGCTIETGRTEAVLSRPTHPYTMALLRAARDRREPDGRFATIEGDPPGPTTHPSLCPFLPRCDRAMAQCSTAMPEPVAIAGQPGHTVRCWRAA